MTRRVKCNAWGNWKGYEGRKGVYDFGTNEQAAQDWAAGGELPKFQPEVFKLKLKPSTRSDGEIALDLYHAFRRSPNNRTTLVMNADLLRAIEALRYHGELVEALQDLVTRCNGAEGVRADGSNIQTMQATALLQKVAS